MTAAPGDAALRALSPSQLAFLVRLPKAELHAHLNGSIPLPLLQELAREYTSSPTTSNGISTGATTTLVAAGVTLNVIGDFFKLFPAIYVLTSTPASLKRATCGVLSHFLDPPPSPASATGPQANGDGDCRGGGEGGHPAVTYIELRTTPRETPYMTRRVYLETVLDEIETRAPDAAALIVSLDRRMSPDVAREVLELVVQLRREGRRVVGVDLCGDPAVRLLYFLQTISALLSLTFDHRR
jgi:adenosine deaminase